MSPPAIFSEAAARRKVATPVVLGPPTLYTYEYYDAGRAPGARPNWRFDLKPGPDQNDRQGVSWLRNAKMGCTPRAKPASAAEFTIADNDKQAFGQRRLARKMAGATSGKLDQPRYGAMGRPNYGWFAWHYY